MHTNVISRHTFRRTARHHERRLEQLLHDNRTARQADDQDNTIRTATELKRSQVPADTQHVRVEKADSDERGRWLLIGTD